MDKKIKIKLPVLPNYLFDEKGSQYSITEFTVEEIKKIGEEWTEALIRHADAKRKNKEKMDMIG